MRFLRYLYFHYKTEINEEWPCVFVLFVIQTVFCLLSFYFFRIFLTYQIAPNASFEENANLLVPLFVFGGLSLVFLSAFFLFEHRLTSESLPRWNVAMKVGLGNKFLIPTFLAGVFFSGAISFLLAYLIDYLICLSNDAVAPSEGRYLGAYASPNVVLFVSLATCLFALIAFAGKVLRYSLLLRRNQK